MNSYKVTNLHAKYIKVNWSSARGGERGRVKFLDAEKRLANGEHIDMIYVSTVGKAFKINKNSKVKAMYESNF